MTAPDPHPRHGANTPNDQRSHTIARKDLPLHCPLPDERLWDSHPRVYIPIEDAPGGRMICPYCGTEYVLRPE